MASAVSLNRTGHFPLWRWNNAFVLRWSARLKLISLFPKMFPDYELGF
jgi:hypothetical protein